jgi:hypothetical protein
VCVRVFGIGNRNMVTARKESPGRLLLPVRGRRLPADRETGAAAVAADRTQYTGYRGGREPAPEFQAGPASGADSDKADLDRWAAGGNLSPLTGGPSSRGSGLQTVQRRLMFAATSPSRTSRIRSSLLAVGTATDRPEEAARTTGRRP